MKYFVTAISCSILAACSGISVYQGEQDVDPVSYCYSQAENKVRNLSGVEDYEAAVESYYDECLAVTPIPIFNDDPKYQFDKSLGYDAAVDQNYNNNF